MGEVSVDGVRTCLASASDLPVDEFARDVQVTSVTGGLFDHVGQQPAERGLRTQVRRLRPRIQVRAIIAAFASEVSRA